VTVGVAGPGLIGGSIALRAQELGYATIGWDIDAANLERALERNAISAAAPSLEALAAQSDILVLAAPLDATLGHLHALAALRYRADLVLDVASVKVPVVRAAAGLRGFVATHPIAGSERSGAGAAGAGLFAAKVWVYDPGAEPAAAGRARAFIVELGATPFPLDPEEHDRIVALTSHLPQLLSVALGAQLAGPLEREAVRALCGTGMASMLRLGASAWPVWHAILSANAQPVAQEVRRLAGILMGVAEALEAGAPEALRRDFDAAAAAVARLEANPTVRVRVEPATDQRHERA
jgi:prephenate dehydrogenase